MEQHISNFMISLSEAVKKWIFLIMLEDQRLVILLHPKSLSN